MTFWQRVQRRKYTLGGIVAGAIGLVALANKGQSETCTFVHNNLHLRHSFCEKRIRFEDGIVAERAAHGLVGQPFDRRQASLDQPGLALPVSLRSGQCVKVFAYTKPKNDIALAIAGAAPGQLTQEAQAAEHNFRLERLCNDAQATLALTATVTPKKGQGKVAIEVY
jgi:hypothetical protein